MVIVNFGIALIIVLAIGFLSARSRQMKYKKTHTEVNKLKKFRRSNLRRIK